jgi:hypothetical protein
MLLFLHNLVIHLVYIYPGLFCWSSVLSNICDYLIAIRSSLGKMIGTVLYDLKCMKYGTSQNVVHSKVTVG